MVYYRVKRKYDNMVRLVYVGNTNKMRQDGIFVGGELYTIKERKKLANSDRYFDIVEIPKSNTYWFFGARHYL